MVTLAETKDNIENARATSESRWSLPGDKALTGLDKPQNRNHKQELKWFYHWAREQGLSRKAAANLVGLSDTTLDRIYKGEYVNPSTNSPYPPTQKMLSLIRKIQAHEIRDLKEEHKHYVNTPTTQDIWQLIDLAVDNGTIAKIWGDSHIGKTHALEWYRDLHNHGRTTYIRCRTSSGVQGLCRQFAEALRLPSTRKGYEDLKRRVQECLGPDDIVLVDEVHLLEATYNRRSKISCFEFLREVHDICKVPMVICGTTTARDEFELGTGEHAKLLQQTDRRGLFELNLPPTVPVADVRAIAAHYKLPFPKPRFTYDKEDKCKYDRWRNYENKDEGFQLMEDFAHAHGIKRIFLTIREGQKLAANDSKPLSWNHVVRAHRIIAKFAQQPKT